MIILAHRGLWKTRSQANSLPALRDALAQGFGIETDLRDDRGRLVISHDPPSGNEPAFEAFLDDYTATGSQSILALNIKSDGLQGRLKAVCATHRIAADRYFVFDMAVPDALSYIDQEFQCFTRESEVEREPAYLPHAAGIWLDCFYRDWIDKAAILKHCDAGRRVALVSPELHGREKETAWAMWRDVHRALTADGRQDMMMICTDYPEQARDYFVA